MNQRRLDYGRMISEALRHVAREALAYVADHGMPGEHHFFLSFRTRDERVHVPPFLRDQYPGEMTVVLQNQFWDLVVDDEGFSVTLAFAGSRQRVMVPWPSLTAFADPSAQLGLRFEPEEGKPAEEGAGPGEGEAGDRPAAWGPERRAAAGPEGGGPTAAGAGEEGGGEKGEKGEGEGGKVVRLDRFRRREEGAGEGEEASPAETPGEEGGPGGGDGDDR